MQNGKDTVYVDVDDEITTIIDKVVGSKQKIVALVLPKRAGVLQSAVNMKLLKRSTDNAAKKVVLVTTEAALMPLAGAAGIHVAATPLSKPEIPATAVAGVGAAAAVDEDEALELDDEPAKAYTAENAGNRPVGELAKGSAGAAAIGTAPSAIETVELDDPATPAKAAAASDPAAKAAKSKQPKIPNFGRFQKKLLLALALLVVLIVGIIFAAFVLPKATIAIATDATDYNSSIDITLDSAASNVSVTKDVVPATVVQQQKTYTQQVAATGQQNNGTKAAGSVQMSTQVCAPNLGNDPSKVPAGTGISANGVTYLTQNDANFNQGKAKGSCINYSSNSVNIVAQKPGTSYNTGSGTSFTVSGRSDVAASGSADGGTDNIVKVVSQSDIDKAKGQITSQDTADIKSALVQQLRQSNLYPIQATFGSGTPNTTSSSSAGTAADNVTVTEAVTYTMYGAKRDYLDQLIKNDIKQQIDPTTQTILNDGLDSASIKSTASTDTTNKINLATTATVGPNLNLDNLKDQVRGKKSGYVKSLIGNQPGVTNVTVKLSPFWVSSVPKKTDKITITVGKSSKSNDAGQ